jgi:Pectate lyase superfamily protein
MVDVVTITTPGIRVVDLPDLGVVNDGSSVVGERAGSGRFSAVALRNYMAAAGTPLVAGATTAVSGDIVTFGDTTGKVISDSGIAANTVVRGPATSPTLSAAMAPVVAASTTSAALQALGVVPAMLSVVLAATPAAAIGVLGGVIASALASISDAFQGSFLVGYFHGVTGWLGRTVSGRLLDFATSADFGCDPTGATDCTAKLQALINYCQATGKRGWILAGTYLVNGTLTITGGGVVLTGDSEYGTILNFSNGTLDCFQVGFQSFPIQGVTIRDMKLVGVGKTGGATITASKFSNSVFSGLSIQHMRDGIRVSQLNNVTIQNTEVIFDGAPSGTMAGITWTSPATSLGRSDLLTVRDFVVNANGHGQYGIYVDGMCQTLRISNSGIIHTGVGLYIRNTAGSSVFYPQFVFVNDLEIDGVDSMCVRIEGGREMHFTQLDCFNAGGSGADTDCMQILADGSASVTNLLTFTDCRFAGAQQRGVYCEAKQVEFTSCYVGDNSVAGSNLWPGIALVNNGGTNGAATGISITGGINGSAFGDIANQSYGVIVGAGCSRIEITGVDFSTCVTGAISDLTGGFGNVEWNGCNNINGAPLPNRLPQVAVDPSPALEGMIWENVTSFQLKVVLNGVIKTVTVT